MTASSSSSFWVHWKAAAVWNRTPREGLGCQLYVYQPNRQSCSFQNCPVQSRTLSAVLSPMFPWWRNGWGIDNVRVPFFWNLKLCLEALLSLSLSLCFSLSLCLSVSISPCPSVSVSVSVSLVPAGSPSLGRDVVVYVKDKSTELAHSFLFCSCVYLCLYGPFNRISVHKFSRQLSAFSLCSSGLTVP